MFYRQFTLIAIATLLLSPNLVNANEIDGDRNLLAGNIQILNTPNGTVIRTPKIQVNTSKSSPGVINRRTRRTRTSIRRTRSAAPLIFNRKVNADVQIIRTTTGSGNNSIMRSSTIRSSSNGGSTQTRSQSSSAQQQSSQCSGSGTVVSQSTSTVNGRTVSSESRTNCN